MVGRVSPERAILSKPANIAGPLHELRQDYRAAWDNQFRSNRVGIPALGATADFHYRIETRYFRMVELARDVDRNDMVVGQGITRLLNNVVQDGFHCDPLTGEEDLDNYLRDWWKGWAEDRSQVHFNKMHDFHAAEKLVLRHVVVDGDHIVLTTDVGSLDLLENHRLRTPINTARHVVHGILLNDYGTPLEYWLTRKNIQPLIPVQRVGDTQAYPAWNKDGTPGVLHLMHPKRVSQHRGVTVMAPTMDPVGMHDDIQFAALVKQQVATSIAILREKPDIDTPPSNTSTSGDVEARSNDNRNPGAATRLLQHLYPGMEVVGEPGEKLTAFTPNVPGDVFFDHSHLILTFIAINLDLPLSVLLLDPSDASFSGLRSVLDQARIGWREWQNWLISVFHRPVWEWKVRQWAAEKSKRGQMLRDALARGVNIFAHIWHPPDWDYIQPETDARADALEVGSGLNSPRRVLGRRGLNWNTIVDETIADNARMIRAAKAMAKRINEEFPDDIDPVRWREVVALAMNEGVKLQLMSPATPTPDGSSQPKPVKGKANVA
jgi:capsid protein